MPFKNNPLAPPGSPRFNAWYANKRRRDRQDDGSGSGIGVTFEIADTWLSPDGHLKGLETLGLPSNLEEGDLLVMAVGSDWSMYDANQNFHTPGSLPRDWPTSGWMQGPQIHAHRYDYPSLHIFWKYAAADEPLPQVRFPTAVSQFWGFSAMVLRGTGFSGYPFAGFAGRSSRLNELTATISALSDTTLLNLSWAMTENSNNNASIVMNASSPDLQSGVEGTSTGFSFWYDQGSGEKTFSWEINDSNSQISVGVDQGTEYTEPSVEIDWDNVSHFLEDANGSPHDVPYPGGTISNGDTLIAFASMGQANSEFTFPSGWTLAASSNGPQFGGVNRDRVFVYTADGTETGTFQVTENSGSTGRIVIHVVRVAGAATVTKLGSQSSSNSATQTVDTSSRSGSGEIVFMVSERSSESFPVENPLFVEYATYPARRQGEGDGSGVGFCSSTLCRDIRDASECEDSYTFRIDWEATSNDFSVMAVQIS